MGRKRWPTRVSHDGRYLAAGPLDEKNAMLDDSQAQKWSELANSDGSIARTHHMVYLVQPTELVRISLPVGKMERVSSEEYNPGLGPVRLGYCPTILRCSGSTGVHKKSTGSIFSIVYL